MFLLYRSVTVPIYFDAVEGSNHITDEKWILLCVRSNSCSLTVCICRHHHGLWVPDSLLACEDNQKTACISDPHLWCMLLSVLVKEMQVTEIG